MFRWFRRKPRPTPYEIGFNVVMNRHREGHSLEVIFMAVSRLDAHGKWPEQVKGSWAAIATIVGEAR